MSYKIKRVSRARDTRADMQIEEVIRESNTPPEHSQTHKSGGSDPITPAMIGAETPLGAEQKINTSIDETINNHVINYHLIGSSSERPDPPPFMGFQYYDTDLKKPIWWDGENWTDAVGNII